MKNIEFVIYSTLFNVLHFDQRRHARVCSHVQSADLSWRPYHVHTGFADLFDQ